MRFESRRGQKRKKGRKHVLLVGRLIFLLVIFSILLFFCTSKMISTA
jgi:hypothetical protein